MLRTVPPCLREPGNSLHRLEGSVFFIPSFLDIQIPNLSVSGSVFWGVQSYLLPQEVAGICPFFWGGIFGIQQDVGNYLNDLRQEDPNIPVVPHEAVPEVSKRKSKYKSTEHVPIEWFVTILIDWTFVLMTRTKLASVEHHHHTNTATQTPPQKHHHTNTTTQTPPQEHHHKNTTTKTPPHKHHHTNCTDWVVLQDSIVLLYCSVTTCRPQRHATRNSLQE